MLLVSNLWIWHLCLISVGSSIHVWTWIIFIFFYLSKCYDQICTFQLSLSDNLNPKIVFFYMHLLNLCTWFLFYNLNTMYVLFYLNLCDIDYYVCLMKEYISVLWTINIYFHFLTDVFDVKIWNACLHIKSEQCLSTQT